ncbi:hypothetical protein Cmtc_14810 [Cupriavidus sp. TKC]|nr:hypothetical protein Cmtc_14810 [Cupriavidus sp. TKC]
MYQIDNSTAAASQPASTSAGAPGFFTDGNPAGGVAATIVPAEWLNAVMMEICNAITAAGLTLSKSTFTQLATAIRAAGRTPVILNDTGAVNAYAAANVPALVAGTWVDGVVQRVKVANTNTGPSTYSPDGLTAIPIYGLALSALQGGEMKAGGVAAMMRFTVAGVNGGNPICVLIDCFGGAQQVPPATQGGHAVQYAQLMGTGSQTIAAGSGNFTVPAGVYQLDVEGQAGAGGGGASSGSAGGGGGGGGGYFRKRIAVTPGQAIAYVVGAGGAPGTNTGGTGNPGANGGTTSIGAFASATGGTGGSGGGASGGAGGGSGAGAGGDLNLLGAPGSAGTADLGGGGGDGAYGGGAGMTYSLPASGVNGGGGCGYGRNNATSGALGKGGDGFLYIRW